MSEFTHNYKGRVEKLSSYILGLIGGKNGTILLDEFKILETFFTPTEVILALEEVMNNESDIEKVKTASNKLFNILFKNLDKRAIGDYQKVKVLNLISDDNFGVKKLLDELKPDIKAINSEFSENLNEKIIKGFENLSKFCTHYTFLQNVVFPQIEKNFSEFACLKILWSLQDDVVDNIKKTLKVLNGKTFDLKLFNKYSSKVYFGINTLIFRENHILLPLVFERLNIEIFDEMLIEMADFNLLFSESISVKPKLKSGTDFSNDIINLSTGKLSIEQLEMVFANLPVDITLVDENDEVKYFSSPKHRIFPRSTSIIGRKVQNCHPHESVHIVNQIVDAFKKGEKDVASFWIKMGEKFVLIKYFALRNENNYYKGVMEVSQEVSEIRKLDGERRLLDW